MDQGVYRPEALLAHMFGEDTGFLVTFTAEQARFRRPDGRPNELACTRQLSWRYPEQAQRAAAYLIDQAQLARDTYIGVHLFRESGNRRATNAVGRVRCLWLDEDGGTYPKTGPEPTAVIFSSRERRQLYWLLTRAVTVEWAVAMNRRIALWARGDIGKAGLSSVLRAPGTANFKRWPQVDVVGGEFTGVPAWEPEVMDEAVPPMPEPEPPPRPRGPYTGPQLELAPYLQAVEVLGEVPDSLGRKFGIICPWIAEHSGGDRTGTYVGQLADGGLWFACHHSHCEGRSWREFRSQLRARAKMMNICRGSRKHAKTKEVRVRRG